MALGMIEVFGFATAIVVADAMAKAADVEIVAIDKNKPAAGDSARVPLVMAVKAGRLRGGRRRRPWPQVRRRPKKEICTSLTR